MSKCLWFLRDCIWLLYMPVSTLCCFYFPLIIMSPTPPYHNIFHPHHHCIHHEYYQLNHLKNARSWFTVSSKHTEHKLDALCNKKLVLFTTREVVYISNCEATCERLADSCSSMCSYSYYCKLFFVVVVHHQINHQYEWVRRVGTIGSMQEAVNTFVGFAVGAFCVDHLGAWFRLWAVVYLLFCCLTWGPFVSNASWGLLSLKYYLGARGG